MKWAGGVIMGSRRGWGVGTWTRMPTCRGDLIIGDSGGGCAERSV